MNTQTIYIRWSPRRGWTYTVYTFSDGAGEDTSTVPPSATGGLAELCPTVNDKDPAAIISHRHTIEAALHHAYPGALCEFGQVPENARPPVG